MVNPGPRHPASPVGKYRWRAAGHRTGGRPPATSWAPSADSFPGRMRAPCPGTHTPTLGIPDSRGITGECIREGDTQLRSAGAARPDRVPAPRARSNRPANGIGFTGVGTIAERIAQAYLARTRAEQHRHHQPEREWTLPQRCAQAPKRRQASHTAPSPLNGPLATSMANPRPADGLRHSQYPSVQAACPVPPAHQRASPVVTIPSIAVVPVARTRPTVPTPAHEYCAPHGS